MKHTNINPASARKLADATNRCWDAICHYDVKAWGKATKDCFEAQKEMYPAMLDSETAKAIEDYKELSYGWKFSGSGGGGYLILIAEKWIPGTIKVTPAG